MKKFILITSILISGNLLAQDRSWVEFGPAGNITNSLLVIGTNVYACQSWELNTLPISTPSGNWSLVASQTNWDFDKLFVDGSYRYLIMSSLVNSTNVILYSNNGGSSYNVSTNTNNFGSIETLAISGGIVYAATSTGLYKSTDHAVTWTLLANGVFETLLIDGTTMLSSDPVNGMVFSNNSGVDWYTSTGWSFSHYIFDIKKFSGTFYAATLDGIFKLNTSNSWNKVCSLSAFVICTYNNRIFASTDEGIVFSSNGNSWSQPFAATNDVPYSNYHYNAFAISSNGDIFTNYIYQVYKGSVSSIISSSVNEVDNNKIIRISPNPANDIISIRVNEDLQNYNIRLINSCGQIVKETQINELNVSNLPEGVYILNLFTEKENYKNKVIIKH